MADTYTTSELIDLVNRLRKENERLKEENKFCHKTITENAQRALEVTLEEIEVAKAEAVKEFVEKLKKKMCLWEEPDGYYTWFIAEGELAALVKEMAGD